MGGNGSYGKALGGVAKKDRTHYDTGYRIDGHKVLVLMENITIIVYFRTKIVMWIVKPLQNNMGEAVIYTLLDLLLIK